MLRKSTKIHKTPWFRNLQAAIVTSYSMYIRNLKNGRRYKLLLSTEKFSIPNLSTPDPPSGYPLWANSAELVPPPSYF